MIFLTDDSLIISVYSYINISSINLVEALNRKYQSE